MRVIILMNKLKVFLLLTILPVSYLVYHLIGFENGINAYFQKVKIIENKLSYQEELINEINYYKDKIMLLNHDVDTDYLEEQSIDLGLSPKNSYTINLM